MNDIELIETIKKLRKDRKRWVKKIYYINNREQYKESVKKYNLNNKEKNKEKSKKYYENNKEKIKDKRKERNKKDYQKEYRKTPTGYKTTKKTQWKAFGLNMNNFESIFKRYMQTSNCDNCKVLLTIDRISTKTTKCMDHDHQTGEFRNVLCHCCNIRRK